MGRLGHSALEVGQGVEFETFSRHVDSFGVADIKPLRGHVQFFGQPGVGERLKGMVTAYLMGASFTAGYLLSSGNVGLIGFVVLVLGWPIAVPGTWFLLWLMAP